MENLMHISLNYREKKNNSHTTSYICYNYCRMNNCLALKLSFQTTFLDRC